MRLRDGIRARTGEALLTLLRLSDAAAALPGLRRLRARLLSRLVRKTGLFDPAFYVDSNDDLGPGIRALRHYVTRGDAEGRQPMALFDPIHYRAQIKGPLKQVNALLHFNYVGRWRRLSPSAWFDLDFYLTQNRDVARARINPLLHYWQWGGLEGRSPSVWFDGAYYLRANPDVERARINPLLHYLRIGRFERRKTMPEHEATGGAESAAMPDECNWSTLWPRSANEQAVVDVIVPVYKGYTETLCCIHSALAARCLTQFELVVVDDASPDAELAEKLAELAGRGLFTLLKNVENVGFVHTVNRGMAFHPGRDVVLLNSDTEVYDGWLDRLRQSALNGLQVGTVTPLSNNATICSYPRFLFDNPFPLELEHRELDAIAARVNEGITVDAPTGVAFCMYLKRGCLDEVGLFDADTFGKGYGEENDFCQRALRAGWRNLIAPNVFVKHWGGTSFAGEKAARVGAAARKLARLHPDYHADVRAFTSADPLAAARARLDWARLTRLRRERNALLICHSRGGGTERRVQEESERLTAAGLGVYLMRPASDARNRVNLRHATARSLPNVEQIDLSHAELLHGRLAELGITELHIHSLVDFRADAASRLIGVARSLGAEVNVALHDYAVICPRINLARDDGLYCGEPDETGCDRCLTASGSDPGHPEIRAWRRLHGDLLAVAQRVTVPDRDVAERLARYFPAVPFQVTPHEECDFSALAARRPSVAHGETLRVAVIGAVGHLKGYAPLLACARNARAQLRAIEFSLLGYSINDLALEKAGVTVTGKYRDDEALDRLRELDPHVVWLPSLWPETYSYTLSIALRAGLPVVAFDIGAIARRLRSLGGPHRILPLRLAGVPEQINDALEQYRSIEGTGYEKGDPRHVSVCD